MKKFTALTLTLLLSFSSCQSKKNSNPLHGTIYRDIKTIQAFRDYEFLGGMVIGSEDDSGNHNYAVTHIRKGKNDVLIFERIIRRKDSPKLDYKILDTISINTLNDSLEILYGVCRQDTVEKSEIIAIVYIDIEKTFFNRVIKAWKADISREKIIRIENLKGIDCINEGDGGCLDESSNGE